MKGFGTVVTGTLLSGTIGKETELEVFPGGRRVRVRGVQVHGAAAEQAIAGQRTALNLAGTAIDGPGARHDADASRRVSHHDARQRAALPAALGQAAARPRARSPARATPAETIAEVAMLAAASRCRRGSRDSRSCASAIRLLVLPGDRFIIRQFSPVVTIGGGAVIDAAPPVKGVSADQTIRFLETVSRGTPPEVLAARVARRGKRGLTVAAAMAETGWWPPQRVEEIAASLAPRADRSANFGRGEDRRRADLRRRISAGARPGGGGGERISFRQSAGGGHRQGRTGGEARPGRNRIQRRAGIAGPRQEAGNLGGDRARRRPRRGDERRGSGVEEDHRAGLRQRRPESSGAQGRARRQ